MQQITGEVLAQEPVRGLPISGAARSEPGLVRLALDLGALEDGHPLSGAERRLVDSAEAVPVTSPDQLERTRIEILAGLDPLGVALCAMRLPGERRKVGAFYTPSAIVFPMIDWVLARRPHRLIDAGCGTGRFVAAVVRSRPDLPVIAVDTDPMATVLTRAALVVLGARHAMVIQTDYTTLEIEPISGRTAFVGNPPYVRHHDLTPAAKAWAVSTGKTLGHRTSALSGLHAHFFLATALQARPGDIGCFVTSAEWLDVNYGSVIRELLTGRLGGQSLHAIDPRAVPFADAMTTAVISCFEVGSKPSILRFRLIQSPDGLVDLNVGEETPRDVVAGSRRWTPLLRGKPLAEGASGARPLGEIAAVHRGLVTGANDFFVLTRQHARYFGIEKWCRPAITSGKEILHACGVIRNNPERRLLLDPPKDIDRSAHPSLDAYLQMGERAQGGEPAICRRYIPKHRRPWWYLGPTVAPPIVATYMARQPPVFALNPDSLALINIGHGIYPRGELAQQELTSLADALNQSRALFRGKGRTYHGGLEKFEPREMESLLVDVVSGAGR